MTDAMAGQMSIFDLGIWCGKTSQEHCQAEIRKAKTSGSSSKKPQGSSIRLPLYLDLRKGRNGLTPDALWETGGALLGVYTTRSFGESPSETEIQEMCFEWGPHSVAEGSRLSQILEEHPHPKYSLSSKACQGILNRANRRGKELPKELREALENQAAANIPQPTWEPTEEQKRQREIDAKIAMARWEAEEELEERLEKLRAELEAQTTPSKSGGGCEVDRFGKKAGKGALVQTDMSGTLSATQDQTLISVEKQTAFGFSAYESNAMKSPNPHSGCYEADTSRTLDNNGGNPTCNQGGVAILEGNGASSSHRGDGYRIGETNYTLNTVEVHAVAVDVRNGVENERTNGTLQAKSNGGTSLNLNNIVRDTTGVDVYNGETTGETAVTLTAHAGGGTRQDPKC